VLANLGRLRLPPLARLLSPRPGDSLALGVFRVRLLRRRHSPVAHHRLRESDGFLFARGLALDRADVTEALARAVLHAPLLSLL
jgi:hypothetical protein